MDILEFKDLKLALQQKFAELTKDTRHLYTANVDKEVIWDLYLDSFPEGTNEIYKERREYDCQCCKSFMRQYGNLLSLKGDKLTSLWDIQVGGQFQPVVDALSSYVKDCGIRGVFVSDVKKLGTDFNHSDDEGLVTKWDHFYLELPQALVTRSTKSKGSLIGSFKTTKDVFQRALEEITLDSIDTVLELIAQKSLYRGEEHKNTLVKLKKHKVAFDKMSPETQGLYCWKTSVVLGGAARVRNTSIGTLLVDISEGKELDRAVRSFEKMVAPANYKRPKAIVTKKMIESAEKQIKDMGFLESLGRRYAVKDDITINNVLFANRDTKRGMNIFDDMKEDVPVDVKRFKKVEEVGIDDFLTNILPNATSLELCMENRHQGNLMSLIAPIEKEAPSMFKWNNGFSWAYKGDVTDSMKERVKAAGGKVDGVLRFSIQWNENSEDQSVDLDAHCIEPGGNHIYFSRTRNPVTSGRLDVDIQRPGTKAAVENITWTQKSKMAEGDYHFYVKNYSSGMCQGGFTAEIEYDGKIYQYVYDTKISGRKNITVAKLSFSKTNGITFTESLPNTTSSKEVCGVKTNKFQKVSMLMHSPNHWDDQGVGNRHYFFMLDGCKNDEEPRGFFNEFLNQDLMEQKRVFEVLGSKLRVEQSDEQLSGLGFSSTQRNSVLCKVDGSFQRTVKINF
jgi:hypothetical protein